jgi:hypothetical protein
MSERTFDRYVIPINVLEGVHNYCNRWCERCRFRPRCTVYVNTNPDSVEARDTVPFEPVLSPELQETLEAAGAFEAPTEAAMAEFDRRERRVRREIARQPALTLAKAYTTAAEVALGELGEAGARDAAEVVRWHQYFIWIKVHRALHGMMDEWFEPDDLEADAYGSAKAALVAMDDVMAAWLELGQHTESVSAVGEAIELLERARSALEAALPRARGFVRAGFDTEPVLTGDQEIRSVQVGDSSSSRPPERL